MNFKIEIPKFKNKQYSILDFGAKSKLKWNNKEAIQKAIDVCSENGGGIVLIPNGYFLTGPIELKSNVNLHLEDNAFLQFTKSKEEYPLIWTNYEGQRKIRAISPITADHQTNIAITGKGVIDGNGFLWRGIKRFKLTDKEFQRCLKLSPYFQETAEGGIWYPTKTVYEGVLAGEPDYNDPNALELASKYYDLYRPVLLSLKHCDKVLIEDITIQNSPAWNIHPFFCTNFTLKNAKVRNKFSAQNGDGLDLESCQNCEIVGTVFEVGDDGICIKSGKNAEARQIEGPCKNVWIHDCKVFDAHGGFVVGSEMSRGVSNILVENCTFIGTDIGVRFKSALGRGGVVEDITMRNIHMANILGEAFIFTMGYVLRNLETTKTDEMTSTNPEDIPEFKNIFMEDICCEHAKIGIKVEGLSALPIHHLFFKNVEICADEALKLSYAKDIHLENVSIEPPNEIQNFQNEVLEG
ncbi:MAG: glycoside hydrolase family 28 protein [Anaeroplasmataceae bacterium]|nr:glycoside hydrolase family 28 protein [Anaeroplasmataceae bacterium]